MNKKLGPRIRIAQETPPHATIDITTRLSRLDHNLNKFIHSNGMRFTTVFVAIAVALLAYNYGPGLPTDPEELRKASHTEHD